MTSGGAAVQGPRADFIREAYLLVLARVPSEGELRDQLRDYESGQERAVVLRFLSSPEFRLLRGEWQSGEGINRDPVEHERGLASLGDDERFVRFAYRWLFDREADPAGLANYVRELTRGLSRTDLVRTFVLSDEFERRYLDISPDAGFVPRDIQLCELANPAKWDNPDWMALLRSLGTLPDHKMAMHRKSYEFTQLVFGLERLGFLRDDVSVVSVGAGHEGVLYWLANRVGRVVATDTYEGVWQTNMAREGDSRVLQDPQEFAPFPYRQDRLSFMRMDGRKLDFPDASFDVAYSLSSIEHFGGVDGARAAVDEMSRVLKPGGLMAVATEYILSGPAYHEGFFPDQIREIFGRPGLALVEPIDEKVYDRYAFRPVDLQKNRHQTPHMVVSDGGSVITSVMVFLRKS
jgi:SAM-dependent methyltransferase